MNKLEVEIFCGATFKHEPSPAKIFYKVLNIWTLDSESGK